eukprot:364615-Chlamydomonas_euryale.AAC.26
MARNCAHRRGGIADTSPARARAVRTAATASTTVRASLRLHASFISMYSGPGSAWKGEDG